MTYVELQSLFDEYHHHGKRRYMKGHYLSELSDAAVDAFVSRGVPAGGPEPDWSRMPNGGFQAYGGAIAEVGDDESAFSQRGALVEFGASTSWLDPAEDAARMSAARAYAAARRAVRERRLRERHHRRGRGRRQARLPAGEARPPGRPQAPLRPGQRLPPQPEHPTRARFMSRRAMPLRSDQ